MMRKGILVLAFSIVAAAASGSSFGEEWKPAKGPLMTRWAKDVQAQKVHPEYPRPQLVRETWSNLNGVWQLGFAKNGEAPPFGQTLAEQILVPFPVESALSGVMKTADRLWYRRTFSVPAAWREQKVLIHFGAVDWESTVWVNGKELGQHRGGYDGFSFDITDALKPGDEQELIVGVFDPTNSGKQPRGKQVKNPGGIYYTSTTGIWQTVWLEPVPALRIEALDVVPDVEGGKVRITALGGSAPADLEVAIVVLDGEKTVATGSGAIGKPVEVAVADAKLWSSERPFLYDLRIDLRRNGARVDSVKSYFGMRSIKVGPDEKGVNRLLLNGKPVFMVGPLDQGFWPDGLYTAPTDEALRFDIEITKKLGFNMTRKHVKVEPDRWYYWCDRLGLLVWQDMPSGDKSIRNVDPDLVRTPDSARQFETELKAMIDGLRNHPSIILWVVFNEGWGQFDTSRMTEWTKAYDPSRLVDCASGWTDRAGVGDVHDLHSYPRPAAPPLEARRAGVLGEFGGLSLGVDGHTWTDKIWGYQGTSSRDDLTRKYERLLREGWEMKDAKGLNALVYTQITDVETEANGLLTYDREVIKVDVDRVRAVNRGDFSRVAQIRDVVASSRAAGIPWRYTFEKPTERWYEADFDASSWKEGPGVFGTEGTPGAAVRTTWNTPDIWMRRTFTLPEVNPANLYLSALHDEDAEFYINGVLAARVKGHVGNYEELAISPEARATLKPGKNVIAVHCHQTGGGQSIDAGFVELKEPSR